MSLARTIALPAWAALALVLVGCQSERPDVPTDAMMVSQGNQLLQYRAENPGTVYVYDLTNHSIAYAGQVRDSQTTIVDPANNRITVDGQPVAQQVLHNGDQYQIFFKNGMTTQTQVNVQKTTVEKSTSPSGGSTSY